MYIVAIASRIVFLLFYSSISFTIILIVCVCVCAFVFFYFISHIYSIVVRRD